MIKTGKLAGMMLLIGLASACSTNSTVSTPLPLAGTQVGYAFEKERASFGQQIAYAEGGFTTRVHDRPQYSRR